jgi:ATP-dependent DNA helicase RecG
MDELDVLLSNLERLIGQGRFEELESDTIEIKPCPANSQDWSERYRSVNAFLNTRGGLLVLGVKESGQGVDRKYVFTGYQPDAEPKLKELHQVFVDSERRPLDCTEYLPPPEIRSFLTGRVAVVRVDELPAQKKFAFFKGSAFKRLLTGDHVIKQAELERYSEFLEEISQAKELAPLGQEDASNVDLDRLNEYILQLNRLHRVESLKPSIEDALPFLTRKRFVIDGRLTVLGALVCGQYPEDLLGFRAHVHGYVNAPTQASVVVQDKQDIIGNILPLLEQANAYVLRNIHAGVGVEQGGRISTQYPESVLRETLNNALAHRDYAINKQVVISITPGRQIEISNPGKFRDQLLIRHASDAVNHLTAVLRVVPETKPRNPRLADVLRVFRKWEGRGIGMATLVSLSLDNKLNLPYFKLKTDEVTLVLQAGSLVDDQLQELFESRDAYIAEKLGSFDELTPEKRAVLAYLIKSEWANSEGKYSILLTPDNNHAQAIKSLEAAGLIARDDRSPDLYPIYVADRKLLSNDFSAELRELFGNAFDELPLASRQVMAVIYRYNHFNSKRAVSAKQASFSLWASEKGNPADIKAFDLFYRSIRRVFNQLESQGFIERDSTPGVKGYVLAKSLKNTQPTLF